MTREKKEKEEGRDGGIDRGFLHAAAKRAGGRRKRGDERNKTGARRGEERDVQGQTGEEDRRGVRRAGITEATKGRKEEKGEEKEKEEEEE